MVARLECITLLLRIMLDGFRDEMNKAGMILVVRVRWKLMRMDDEIRP